MKIKRFILSSPNLEKYEYFSIFLI